MGELYQNFIKKMPFYHPLRNWQVRKRHKREFSEWLEKGKPVPPPHYVKQQALHTHAEKFGLKILVETGTYYGDMIEAMKTSFDRIYSVELSKQLYEDAQKRFKTDRHVELLQGDSGSEIEKIVKKLDGPALFWLDGHYSGGVTAQASKDTPIYDELSHIFDGPEFNHVIIIDDARCFGTDPAYPTIEDLTKFVKSNKPDVDIDVQDDSIRITPKS